VANISPGFPSESVKHRPEETTDDFNEAGSYVNDKPSSNTPSGDTQKGIVNRKGLFILYELLRQNVSRASLLDTSNIV